MSDPRSSQAGPRSGAQTAASPPEPLSAGAADQLGAWLDDVLAQAGRVSDAFEARAETRRGRQASVQGGTLNVFHESFLDGVCVRLWTGGAVGFASTHELTKAGIEDMVQRASRMAERNARHGAGAFPFEPGSAERVAHRPDIVEDLTAVEPSEIAALLHQGHDAAVDAVPQGKAQTMLGASSRRILYANSAGRNADTAFALATVQTRVLHKADGRLGYGSEWTAGERGLESLPSDLIEADAREAAKLAAESAIARPAPAGRHRVLCDNYLSGLLAHESFGHLTEYDLVSMRWSMLHGQRGERFADEGVSVLDAPETPGDPLTGVRVPYDEEGTPGRTVKVLDRGRLAHWMHLRGSAAETDDAPTGNARALNVRYPPIVRMRNTFFEPGELSVEEALEALGDGLYLIRGYGGEPACDGSFMFTAYRGYRVEGGELKEPLRSTSISGNIFDFLRGVEGITRDFKVQTSNFGGCGKWSQSFLPVGIGGPHVLVGSALVGGESAG